MKTTDKMSRAVGQLEKMYNVLNAEKFGGALPIPIITIQSKPGTWGSCSRAKIWRSGEKEQYEMNIAAETCNGVIEEIIDTLLHEMVHLYCRENGVKEVSRGGKYHNRRFKELAEKVGLVCVEYGQYGWNTVGTGNDALTQFALDHDWNEIRIGRNPLAGLATMIGGAAADGQGQAQPSGGREKAPSSTRKYICPCCGNSFRATKELRVLCMDCGVQFELAERKEMKQRETA